MSRSKTCHAGTAPNPSDQPLLRTVDFSLAPPVIQTSIFLRRMWTIDWSAHIRGDSEDERTTALHEFFGATVAAVMRAVAEAPPEEKQDDELWRRQTELRLLEPPLGNADDEDGEETPRAVMSHWRQQLYRLYGHIFADAYNMLRDEIPWIGEYKAPSVSLWIVHKDPSDPEAARRTRPPLDQDTFVYPVWVNPQAKVTFLAEEAESGHTWSADASTLTAVLWINGEESKRLRVEVDAEDEHTAAAVLVFGQCEERKPTSRQTDRYPVPASHEKPEAGPDTPQFAAEGDVLARALFLRAGSVVESCTYDDVSSGVDEDDLDRKLQELSIATAALYQPLPDKNSTRVLAVRPEKDGIELRTQLLTISLEDPPAYEALSYTWGDPEDHSLLPCGNSNISVPNNLKAFLTRIRHQDRCRYVWADAACINQQDIQERGQQVSIMRDIFLKAQRVLSWLGQDEEAQSTKAFGAVCKIVSSWRPLTDKLKFESYTNAFEPREDDRALALGDSEWAALKTMLEAPYFSRFWVIQELALAKSDVVIWGEHHISWGLVGIAAAWLLTRGWSKAPGGPVTASFNAFLMYVLPLAKYSDLAAFAKLDLSVVLGVTMDRFHSTNPRDRIYALLGMPFSGNVLDGNQGDLADQLEALSGIASIKPAYDRSVRSVYVDATRRMLGQDGHLRLLSALQHGAEVDPSWPSWVPRWDRTFSAEPLALCGEHGYYANAGELFFPNEDSFGDDGESLVLRGLRCTTVAGISEPFARGKIRAASLVEQDRAALASLLDQLNDESKQLRASWSATLEKITIPGVENPEKQAELMASGAKMAVTTGLPGKYNMRESTEMVTGEKAQLDSMGDFLLYWRERSTWRADEIEAEELGGFWEGVDRNNPYHMERALSTVNVLYGRRIFHCEDGKFGLGPAAMRHGDVVAVLFGGIVPYILRPLADGRWSLLGECFVPELMQGEAVEAAGLLRPGLFDRLDDGSLRLNPAETDSSDGPRFSRRVGECGVTRFEIR